MNGIIAAPWAGCAERSPAAYSELKLTVFWLLVMVGGEMEDDRLSFPLAGKQRRRSLEMADVNFNGTKGKPTSSWKVTYFTVWNVRFNGGGGGYRIGACRAKEKRKLWNLNDLYRSVCLKQRKNVIGSHGAECYLFVASMGKISHECCACSPRSGDLWFHELAKTSLRSTAS